jgi:hypothetical protein
MKDAIAFIVLFIVLLWRAEGMTQQLKALRRKRAEAAG